MSRQSEGAYYRKWPHTLLGQRERLARAGRRMHNARTILGNVKPPRGVEPDVDLEAARVDARAALDTAAAKLRKLEILLDAAANLEAMRAALDADAEADR